MNRSQALRAANEIDERYLRMGGLVLPIRKEAGNDRMHLRWMVQEMNKPDFSDNKTMRWLGYIQGVMVARGWAELEDMKFINREASTKES